MQKLFCVNNIETVKHIIIDCVAYNCISNGLEQLWKSTEEEVIYNLVCDALTHSDDYLLQFILSYVTLLGHGVSQDTKHG